MNKDYTEIAVVQDKSGSMSSVRDDTIGGFNTFLAEQKKAPGKCTFTLMQFDTTFNLLYTGEDIQKVEPLTHKTYMPGGSTALLDAISRTILTTGQRLEAMKEEERPARVIVAILTDGQENASQEFGGPSGRAKVFEMIKAQTDKYNWVFVFIGANQDGIQAGSGMGITVANSISTANNTKGVTAAYVSLGHNSRQYRLSDPADTETMRFSSSQRKEQYDAGATKDAMAGNPPGDLKGKKA